MMPLELNGSGLKVTGRVAEIYPDDGTLLVEFGVPGGGALGVRVQGKGVAVGDPFTVDATVTKAEVDTLGVSVLNFAGDPQAIPLDRTRTVAIVAV
jgi:hypothetical protein